MKRETKRGVKECVAFGVVAGVIFALAEVGTAVMMGDPAIMPFRMFASVLLGRGALETATPATVLIVGSTAHIALSAAFGFLYAMLNAGFSETTHTRWGRQTALGVAFGALLWLVNFQVIARLVYPWFLEAPQFTQLLLHALFYGLPLALFYTRAERHVVARPVAHA